MLRLPVLLLLVSLVLAIDQSADDRLETRINVKPDIALNTNILQRRRQGLPNVEIKEINAGRYFRRRPQTTTVPSIFSMKVESESQHVYPNMSPSENFNIQPKEEENNMTEITTPKQQQNFPRRRANWNRQRANNEHRRIQNTNRRRPIYIQTSTPIVEQIEEITEKVISTTTTAPTVETTMTELKEQQKVVLDTYKVSNEVPSLKHPTISQIPEAIIETIKETSEKEIISRTNTPLVVSFTEKEPKKSEFIPSAAYLSNLMKHVKKHRPVIALKSASSLIQHNEAAKKETIDPTTTAPIAVSNAEKEQEKIILSPPASYVSDLVSITRPKSRRPFNRRLRKFNLSEIKKDESNVKSSDLDSNSSNVTSTTQKTPPPVPTLSPWYDGFGK